MQISNFINFVIKADEQIEVSLVKFESSDLGYSHHIQKDKVRFLNVCKLWC